MVAEELTDSLDPEAGALLDPARCLKVQQGQTRARLVWLGFRWRFFLVSHTYRNCV